VFIMRENIAVNNVVYSQIITQSSLVQLRAPRLTEREKIAQM
jgi:hypothetical protein